MNSSSEAVIEVNPEMEPVEPYNVRYAPDVRWTGTHNRSYLIFAVDVGFGTLSYLALRSPIGDKVSFHQKVSLSRALSKTCMVILHSRKCNQDFTMEICSIVQMLSFWPFRNLFI